MALLTSLDLPGMPTRSVSCRPLHQGDGQRVERGSARSMSVPSRRRDERSFSQGAMTLPIRRRGERSSSQSSCRDSKPSTSALTEPCFAISETEAWLQEDRARQETATSLSRQSSSCSFSNCFDAFGLDDVGDLQRDSSGTAVMKEGHYDMSISIVPQPRDERAKKTVLVWQNALRLKEFSPLCSQLNKPSTEWLSLGRRRVQHVCVHGKIQANSIQMHRHQQQPLSLARLVGGAQTFRTKVRCRHHCQTGTSMSRLGQMAGDRSLRTVVGAWSERVLSPAQDILLVILPLAVANMAFAADHAYCCSCVF